MQKMNPAKALNTSGTKQKTSLAPLKKLLSYGKKFIVPFCIAIAFTIVGVVCTLVGPNKLGELANTISSGLMTGTMDLNLVTGIAIFLVVIYAIGAICNYGEGIILAIITQKVSKNLRRDISNKINKETIIIQIRNIFNHLVVRYVSFHIVISTHTKYNTIRCFCSY